MSNEIAKVNDKDRAIARLAAQGIDNRVIASRIGTTASRVRDALTKPLVQEMLVMFREMDASELVEFAGQVTASKILEQAAPRAAEVVVASLDTEDPALAFRAAEGVLDRTGHAKKTEITRNIVLLDAEMLRLIEDTKRLAFGEEVKEADFELITEDDDESV